jgi:starch synthase
MIDENLKVLIVSAECVPFAKTGGLGDVTGALPLYLKRFGHEARIVIPLYSFIDTKKYGITKDVIELSVQMEGELITCHIATATINGEVPVYFIDYAPFFDRTNIYHDNDFVDYEDNPMRFAFFSKAALDLCRFIEFKPDIVHANDWHTAIIPAYIKTIFKADPYFRDTASVLTIHNMTYQGKYAGYYYSYTGLPGRYFNFDSFESYGDINFMKGGIRFADMVNTVSPGYAAETRNPEGGYGMEYYLNARGGNYIGILNGVDYSEWDPAKDTLIPANYSPDDLKGKAACKKALQKKLGLKQVTRTPVIGIVSRFAEQKGLYLLSECIENILNDMDVQFAILGAGDKQLESFFSSLVAPYAGRAGVHIGYSNELAHLIGAGSDFFLMPSIFEPCGLNQIYSLKYGTLPIVRATGGLNDTIDNYNEKTGEGTGFKFWEASPKALYNTVKWALETYYNRKPHIKKLVMNAMKQHYSWDDSAQEYVKLYLRALKNSKVKHPTEVY